MDEEICLCDLVRSQPQCVCLSLRHALFQRIFKNKFF